MRWVVSICGRLFQVSGVRLRSLLGEKIYATPVAMAELMHHGIAGSSLKIIEDGGISRPLSIRGVLLEEINHSHRRRTIVKFTGELDRCGIARSRIRQAVRCARFFASCVDGVSDLNEIDAVTHYTATP